MYLGIGEGMPRNSGIGIIEAIVEELPYNDNRNKQQEKHDYLQGAFP